MENQLTLEQIFYSVPLKVKKHKNYFAIYEEILGPYRNREVKVLEIGVLDGGSLLLWKRYLGSSATVVGVDVNPRVAELNSNEFQVIVGDQSSSELWEQLRRTYNKFDIIIDDGGHTNRQQLLTLVNSIDLLKDSGKLIVEDTHCSYMSNFGNPSKYSFVNFAFRVADKINSRFFVTPNDFISKSIFSIKFYESIIVFEVNRPNCNLNDEVSNVSTPSTRGDHRYRSDRFYTWVEKEVTNALRPFISNHELQKFLKAIKRGLIQTYLRFKFNRENIKLRNYFKSIR